MTPAFSSWSAFWAMGGYGFFVWSAFSCVLLTFFFLWIHSALRRRQLLTAVLRDQARRDRRNGKKHQAPQEPRHESAA